MGTEYVAHSSCERAPPGQGPKDIDGAVQFDGSEVEFDVFGC